ncbi:orotidine-5'-phosphate decarboxylase [Euzebya tangerina]|uniref:orotidine-5'-phosphate decarboxylase n=1 Tax=Euzebya tangerina TaxID=591198 RepID=UPI000E31709F|nr:orotidine-5'-phosphate decarboxylase [Euzebya tangerina]
MTNPLIPALDSDDREEVLRWAEALASEAGLLKVGLQAFVAHGPSLITEVAKLAPVFADLKLHDIPNTVAGAARVAAGLGASMVTVHASGGAAMVRAAAQSAPDVDVLAVTVLTSLAADDIQAVGQQPAERQVPQLAALAVEAGAAGIVCSAGEIEAVRAAVGPEPLIVVPGIRPAGAAADDQARTATPAAAMARGASHIVVGRPITQAADPVAAARSITASLRR